MPRSAVYGQVISTYDPSGLADVETPTKLDVQLVAQVGWTKGAGVIQVGISGRDPESGAEIGLPGFYADLDWAGCNRLIAELRAARDQAFGKPE